MEIPFDLEFYRLYMEGREVESWGRVGASRYGRMQSTVKVGPAHDHAGGVHTTLLIHGKK